MDDELRLRTRMVGAGLWLSAVLIAAVGAWIAATWQEPHRGALLAITAVAAVVTGIIALAPHERIVAGRWREPFFLTWSLSLIVLIATEAILDAGVRSPIVLMLFLTLVYAAISYPRWAVSVVSVASLLAVVAVSEIHAGHGAMPTDPVYLAGLMVTLAVTGVLCIVQARTQEEARRELQRISRTDPLTGALNRLGFAERMTAELGRAERDEQPVALVVLDFDGFKQINDRAGHSAGDELLRWSVGAMAAVLRPADALARLGGDEFAALLPATGLQEAEQVAGRLQLALSLKVSACAGAAATDHDGDGADALHHRADQRLYAAKRDRGTGEPLRVAAG